MSKNQPIKQPITNMSDKLRASANVVIATNKLKNINQGPQQILTMGIKPPQEITEEEFNKIVVPDGDGNYYLTVKLEKKDMEGDNTKSVLELKSIVDKLYHEVNTIPVATTEIISKAPLSVSTEGPIDKLKTFTVLNDEITNISNTDLNNFLQENRDLVSKTDIGKIITDNDNLVVYIKEWKSKNLQQKSNGGRRIPSQRRKSLRSKSVIQKTTRRGYSNYSPIRRTARRSLAPITRKNMYSSYLY